MSLKRYHADLIKIKEGRANYALFLSQESINFVDIFEQLVIKELIKESTVDNKDNLRREIFIANETQDIFDKLDESKVVFIYLWSKEGNKLTKQPKIELNTNDSKLSHLLDSLF